MRDALRPTSRGPIAASLVRDFLTTTLAHDALADEVTELLFEHVARDARNPGASRVRCAD